MARQIKIFSLTGEEIVRDMTPEEEAVVESIRAEGAALRKPKSVTRYQAMIALKRAGLLGGVRQLINDPQTDEEITLAWENANTFERDSPFIQALAPALNLTEEDVDNLFAAAIQIK